MFTETYSAEAQRVARRIEKTNKSSLEHLKSDDLRLVADDFLYELNGDDREAILIRSSMNLPKARLAGQLRNSAGVVIDKSRTESNVKYLWIQRHQFYANLVAKRTSAQELVRKTADAIVDGYHWGSDVDTLVKAKSQVDAYDFVIHTIEGGCTVLSLGEAIEHALYRAQRELISKTRYGSESTSRGHNWKEATYVTGIASILGDIEFLGVTPTDHRNKFPSA